MVLLRKCIRPIWFTYMVRNGSHMQGLRNTVALDLALGCNAPIDMNADLTWAYHMHGRPGWIIMCILSNLGRTYKDMSLHHVVVTCASKTRATMYEVHGRVWCILFVFQLLKIMVVVCVCRSVLRWSPGLTLLNTPGFSIAHRTQWCKLPMK